MANISNALIGNTPGVSGLQTSGEPGHNAANIRIRGISTYGSASPLIVIDGVEQPSEQAMSELNAMDANEIQGISVLKDASSTAVYGIRGANGVSDYRHYATRQHGSPDSEFFDELRLYAGFEFPEGHLFL